MRAGEDGAWRACDGWPTVCTRCPTPPTGSRHLSPRDCRRCASRSDAPRRAWRDGPPSTPLSARSTWTRAPPPSPRSRSGAPPPGLRSRSWRETRASLSVSMTDRADWAVSAVAPHGLAVGTDLELVEARTEAFVRDWFTPAERGLVLRTSLGVPAISLQTWCGRRRRARSRCSRPVFDTTRARSRSTSSRWTVIGDGRAWPSAPRRGRGSRVGGVATATSCSPSSPMPTPRLPPRWRNRPASPRPFPPTRGSRSSEPQSVSPRCRAVPAMPRSSASTR